MITLCSNYRYNAHMRMSATKNGNYMIGGNNMEQSKREIGPVTYVISRKFVGNKLIKDVILEKMLTDKSPHHSTAHS